MPTLREQIAELRREIGLLRRRLRKEQARERKQRLPEDVMFDPWRVQAKRDRYLKMIVSEDVPSDSPVSRHREEVTEEQVRRSGESEGARPMVAAGGS